MKFTPKMKNLKDIKEPSKMLLDVRQRPKWKTWLLLSIQHVFAMFGATVLIPILINHGVAEHIFGAGTEESVNVIGSDVALFSSGVGTLIYIAVTAARVPIYLGSSAAYVAAVGSLFPIYGTSTFFGFLGVGLVYLVVALLIYLFGTNWLKKILPPVVVGPMIMVIGLGLAGIAVNTIGLNNVKNDASHWWGLLVTFITVGVGMLTSLLFRGKLKLMPILMSLMVGLIISMIVSSWQHGFVNYDSKDWKSLDTYLGVPDFKHTMLTGKDEIYHTIQTGADKGTIKHITTKWSVFPFFAMMPIAFATIAEHIGDHTVLGKITGRDYINGQPGLHRTLIGDGVATMFGGVVGGPANTSYGENTTTVGLSRVASVYVTGLAAVFAILMSFIQLVPSILGLIPNSVIGGVELILFGFIASNGLKVLIDKKVDMHEVRNVFIISIMLVIGLGGAVLGWTMGETTIQFAGTSLAMFFGIIANLLLPKDRGIDESKMPKPHK